MNQAVVDRLGRLSEPFQPNSIEEINTLTTRFLNLSDVDPPFMVDVNGSDVTESGRYFFNAYSMFHICCNKVKRFPC